MSAVPTAPATMAAARAALWAQLRLVVIDVETTAADDGLHVIEVAAVICRDGRRTSRTWTVRVNPGVRSTLARTPSTASPTTTWSTSRRSPPSWLN